MSAVKPPPAPPVDEIDDGFKIVRATIRGTTYVVRELGADEYEKCVQQARNADTDTIDNVLLLKLMLAKGLKEPPITQSELWKKPYPVIRKLNDIVNELHFEELESDEEKAEREAAEAAESEKGEEQG